MDPESESALGQLLQAAMLVGAGSTRLNTTPIVPGMKTEFPGPPPVYDGHGFGPPVILDLSPRGVDHLPSIQSPYTPVTVDGESGGEMETRVKREVKTESPDFAAGDDASEDDDQVDGGELQDEMGGGCSRTMGRMPEASLLKWHQRRRKQQEEQLQVIQSASAMTLDSSVLSPPRDLDSAASSPKRKTLIHPQRKHNAKASASSNVAIPVGIAVARQRRDKCRSDTPMPPVQPKARRATQSSPLSYSTDPMCMSNASIASTDQHSFDSPSSLAGLSANYAGGRAVYNPTALYAGHPTPIAANAANWAWPNAADYSAAAAAHSLWSATDVNSIMRYSAYPPTPQTSNVSSSLLHQHHHPVGGMTPPPFLLIPTACLDPYQRAATVYWQGYATPAQSPWGLPPDMATSPTASWALHPPVRSAFELPILRADVTPYEDPTTHAPKPACVISSPPAAMSDIKEERISPEPPGHVPEKVESSIQLERAQPLDSSTATEPASIRVRDNLTIGWVSRDPSGRSPSPSLDDENVPRSLSTGHLESPAPVADYSGLHLLSDSIEQFVSAADQSKLANEPQAIETQTKDEHCNDSVTAVEMAGNALDVLCAAALYQQSDSPQSGEPREISAATSCPRPTGFQVEFDFRSKLAELQRKYKEKQKELSSLKCKKKSDKKRKKKKRSSSDKEDKAGRRRNSSSSSSRDGSHHSATKQQEQSSEPGKIVSAPVDFIVPGRLDLPSSTHRSSSGVEVEFPRIPTSYAAALASAANAMAPSAPVNETATVEKKKRKPECPVRKQDSELTETIVPSKKRKFFQLFQWCHSADPTSKKNKKKNSSGHDTKSPVKPKIKPKLKAEVQVKQLNSSSSEESEDELKAVEEDLPEEDSDRLERHCLPALQFLQLSDDSGAEMDTIPVASSPAPAPSPPPPVPPTPPPLVTESVIESPAIDPDAKMSDPEPNDSTTSAIQSPWLLTQDLLQDGLRVLIAEEGLFHGGSVSGIRPPDIYGVVVDGERGSRPRILSTEELLHEALLEVCPHGLSQLQVGTRVCGYWSRKSRCLYPGVVSNVHPAGPPNNAGSRSVTREDEIDVEFDDGDSGRIPVSQIRLLPPDYPVLERDRNPLLKIESRRHKRRISEPAPIPVASAVKPSIQQESAEVKAEEADETAEKKNKKAEGDECKENNDDGNVLLKKCKKNKKHKKKHKKKRKAETSADETLAEQPDLIIPISPGLTIDHAVESAANDSEPIVKMETRASKEAVNYSAPPIARRSAAKTRSPEPQQQIEQQPRKANKSKMAAFLPERQLWQWLGASFKKASKGKGRKEFYKAIHRGDEIIRVGDCAVFLSAGRPDRPYVGRIELLWQSWGGSMTVKVRWFYHPEETCGGRRLTHLKIPGALFESNHVDENDVQTISHCCTVCSLDDYRLLCKGKPDVNLNLDATNSSGYDQFYLAGFYDPTSGHLSFESDVLEQQQQQQ